MTAWQTMDSAPKDRRILIKSVGGGMYCAHWVQHALNGDEAWCIVEWGDDGEQALCKEVTAWAEIPK